MENMLQWKASYFRSDGSPGLVYMAFPQEPMMADLMDSILGWDLDSQYQIVNAEPGADRTAQAIAFFELNHITRIYVRSLDDLLDSSSDA